MTRMSLLQQAPRFDVAKAVAIARGGFGIDASARPLTWAVDWANLEGFEDWLTDRLTATPKR